jgi:STE24 endopeptidase
MGDPTQPQSPEKRRLAAVVFTDVVGYSARMQQDEESTIAGVDADFDRMRAMCAEKGGDVLNSMGDGLLLCFPSAARAVSFALTMQEEFAARKSTTPAGEALEHRVGVHLGDVIFADNGSIAGDGVNIASRLESKAPPGGICISQTVYDTVKGKVPMQSRFAGPQTLKNIAQPIPVWHIWPVGMALPEAAPSSGAPPPRPRRMVKRWLVSGVSAALVLAIAGGGLLVSRRDATPAQPGAGEKMARADSKSIAVLPFTNMSDSKDNAYFADGMQEELLTQLALVGELKVVSRTSVMDYRDTKKNIRQIGAELGVRSLLEGSVRRAGDIVRVTVQLIDATSDKHLWANSYERKLKDIFAIQNELAGEIARALKVSLSAHDEAALARKPTEDLAAYDSFLRYQELANRAKGSPDSAATAKERMAPLLRAVELDPKFALAWARLGTEHAQIHENGIDHTAARLEQARQAIERARALAPNDIEMQIAEGNFYLTGGNDMKRAAQSFENALRLAPNNVDARMGLFSVKWKEHQWADSAVHLEKVLAVDVRNAAAGEAMEGIAQVDDAWRKALPRDPELATQAYLARVSPDFRARSDAYSEGKNWLAIWNLIFFVAISWLMLARGRSAALAAWAQRVTKRRFVAALIVIATYLALLWLLGLPESIYEDFFREREFGMTTQGFGPWIGQQLLALVVSVVFVSPMFAALYVVFKRAGRNGWWWGALAGSAIIAFSNLLWPAMDPLFETHKPIEAGAVKEAILSLARANGIPAENVFQIDTMGRSTIAYAKVSGYIWNPSLAVTDNLLRTSLPEIRAKVAHEIGHVAMHHAVINLFSTILVLAAGLAFVQFGFGAVLRRWGSGWNIVDHTDIGGLPLLWALLTVIFGLTVPLHHTANRSQEIDADQFSLRIAREPDGLADIALKQGKSRKLEPGPVEEWIFYEFPSGYQRVHAAMAWKAGNPAKD